MKKEVRLELVENVEFCKLLTKECKNLDELILGLRRAKTKEEHADCVVPAIRLLTKIIKMTIPQRSK